MHDTTTSTIGHGGTNHGDSATSHGHRSDSHRGGSRRRSTPPPSVTIAALVAATRRGCGRAETDLYDHYRPMVEAVAHRHGLDDHGSADVVQRSWLKARQGLSGLRRDDRFGPWLAAIARNESINLIRTQSREVGLPETDLVDEHLGGLDGLLVADEEHRRVHDALAHLDPADRELIRLLFEEGRNYRDVARALDRPMGSIGPTRARVLRRLRALMTVAGPAPMLAAA